MIYGEQKKQVNEERLEECSKELAEEKAQLTELERQVAVSHLVGTQQWLKHPDPQMKIDLMHSENLQMVSHHIYFKI